VAGGIAALTALAWWTGARREVPAAGDADLQVAT
jgi:hypothetical protein